MDKKLKKLSIIPFLSSFVAFVWLSFKVLKREVNKKTYVKYCIGFFLLSAFTVLFTALLLYLLNQLFNIAKFMLNGGLAVVYIFNGYLMNLFTIILLNKYYENLFLT